jgi:uncharacterized protein (TIGR02001 family)
MHAEADVGLGVAALSDYRFRGVSLTDGQPAVQANVDWSHDNGLFAGALLSTVRLGHAGEVSGVGTQGYAGLSRPLAPGWSWSAGVAAYLFPSLPRVGSPNYAELFARLGSERLQAGVHLSNSYFGSGADSAYLSLSASLGLRDGVTAVSHLGWLVTGSARSGYYFYDTEQRVDGRLGLAFDARYFTAELSVVGATTDNATCRLQRQACDATVVLVLRKDF